MLTNKQIWTGGSLAFWSWNDLLDREQLLVQLEHFREAGLSGAFLHARGGLGIEYLGEEWLDAVALCVQFAQEQSFEIWLYDEDAWPSGFCGGKVPAAGEEHQQKWLAYERLKAGAVRTGARTIACFAEDGVGGWALVGNEEALAGLPAETMLLHVYYSVNTYYSDLLSPDTVRLFIESTYEVYRQRFGSHFGAAIRGIFTDEPQYAAGQLPWSPALGEKFLQLYGYALSETLPHLLFETERSLVARHDYWHAVSACFTAAYAQQIGEWCEQHGLCFTGHFAAEDTLRGQMVAAGEVMRKYEWMHMPGIDHLGNRITRPVLPKQLSSVARQLGKRQAVSEMFGCSGWGATLADLKYIADWHYVLGVNVQCQHLAAYSLRGIRKRDYPPSISYQQPWWQDFTMFTGHADFVQKWLLKGEPMVDVLILHPITSVWCIYDASDAQQVRELDRRFGELSELLLEMNIDYDYADEHLLEKYGEVEAGGIRVGAMRYQKLILPALHSIEPHTYALLRQFRQQGGQIISVGQLPYLLAGHDSPELEQWCAKHTTRVMPIRKTLQAVLKGTGHGQPVRGLTIYDRNGKPNRTVYSHERVDGEQRIYFLLNMGDQPWSGRIDCPGLAEVRQEFAEPSEPVYLETVHSPAGTSWRFQLAARESAILIAEPLSGKDSFQPEQAFQQVGSIELGGSWTWGEEPENQLTLDTCQYRIAGDHTWSGWLNHLQVQEELTKLNQTVQIEQRFAFGIAADFDLKQPVDLALEDAGLSVIICNGKQVAAHATAQRQWFDPALERIALASYLIHGENNIIITRTFLSGGSNLNYLLDEHVFETEKNRFHQKTELESIYLIGPFGVSPEGGFSKQADAVHRCAPGAFMLTPLPRQVLIHDLTTQGLPFFAGTVCLESRFQCADAHHKVEVVLDGLQAVVAAVELNGTRMGQRAWAPYSIDITSAVQVGNNQIKLYLTSGYRNLLGPHHHYLGEVGFVGPSIFKGTRGWEDQIYAYDVPDRTWTDQYSFIKFGTGNAPSIRFFK